MKRIFLLIGVAMLTACVADGIPVESSFVSTRCGSVGGYTQTKVTYGVDGIEVRDLTKVRVDTEFRIKLKPKPKNDWKDNEVTIKGDTAKSDANADWIDGSAKEEDLTNGWFVAGCVPNVEVGTEYKFDIEVEDLPVLDPRVEVIN